MKTLLVTLRVKRGSVAATQDRTYTVAAPEGHHLRHAARLAQSEGFVALRREDGAIWGQVEDEG